MLAGVPTNDSVVALIPLEMLYFTAYHYLKCIA